MTALAHRPPVAGGQIVLEAFGIEKRFGNVRALRGASLSIRAAAVTAIVGDNGAGKSTLIKCMSGLHTPDRGHLSVDGEEVSFSSSDEARKAGIETVYQDLALVDQLTVAQNLFLNREQVYSLGPFRFLNRRAMRRQAQERLSELGIHVPSVTAKVRDLSGGQRQGVAISRAVHWAKRVIILDEPTAALGVKETRQVESTVADLGRGGAAVVMVSHNIDQVMRLASQVWVMRAGRVVGGLNTATASHEDIVGLITGANVGDGP
jgi:ABC-type sugar transport system ATPase subunit